MYFAETSPTTSSVSAKKSYEFLVSGKMFKLILARSCDESESGNMLVAEWFKLWVSHRPEAQVAPSGGQKLNPTGQ